MDDMENWMIWMFRRLYDRERPVGKIFIKIVNNCKFQQFMGTRIWFLMNNFM